MYLFNLQLTVDHISSTKTITLKFGSGGLWFLCGTLPLIRVYLPIKFHAEILCGH